MVVRLLEILVFFVGLSFGALGAAGVYSARNRRAWAIAKGTIHSTEILELGSHFAGVVRYVYALQAVSAYRGGDHQAVGLTGKLESAPSTSRHDAEELLRRYPVGERIEVRYDPARPSRSALAPVAPHAALAACMGLGGLTLSVASVVISLTY